MTDQHSEISRAEWAQLDWRLGRKSSLPWTECRGSTIAIFGTPLAYKYSITCVRNGVRRQWWSRCAHATVEYTIDAARLQFLREGL